MAKKKAIKLAAASAVAASAFVAAAPAQTDAASNVATEVSKAVTQMKKAYHTYSDVTATGDFADIKVVYKEYNAAKAAYSSAKALVSSSKDAAKDAYLAQLDSTYAEYIAKRVVTYIDAYNYATTLADKQADLEAALVAKDWDGAEELYHAISYELKTRTVILDRVYGKSTRELLRASFKADAQAARDSIAYEVTVKIALDKAAELVEAGKLVEAKAQLDKAAENAAEIDKDADFGKALVAEQATVKAAYEAKLTPAVESVTALNGTELVVTFNKAVNEADAETPANYKLNGVAIGTPVLSEDGKTVTISTSTAINVTNQTLEISPISTKADVEKKTTKYVTLFSYKDTVAPTVAKVEAKDGKAVVTFAEGLANNPGVSVNGVTHTNYTVSGKTLTINGLTNDKTYSVEIVGAKDLAQNIANPISLNFTVSKPDVVLPQAVTTSVKENLVSLTFVNALSSSNTATVVFADGKALNTTGLVLNGTASEGVTYSEDKKTVTLDAQSLGVLGSLNFLTTSVNVTWSGLATPAKSTVTLNSDKTAASLVSSQTTAAGKLVLEFNEEVQDLASLALKVLSIDDIYQSSPQTWSGLDVNYAVDAKGNAIKNKLEVTLPSTVKVGTKYSVEVPASVQDKYNNTTAKFTVSVVKPESDNTYKAGEVITVGKSVSGNVIKLTFAGTKEDKGVTTSATTLSNYKLGGKELPVGTVVRYVDDKNNVEIVLPAGSIATTGDYVLELANIADAAGNTLVPAGTKQTVTLTENVAPVLGSLAVKSSSELVVTFSEAVQHSDITGVTGYTADKLDGVTVKVNGATVTASSVLTASQLTISGLNLKVTDAVTVEFKNAEIFDASANKNQLKDGVVTK